MSPNHNESFSPVLRRSERQKWHQQRLKNQLHWQTACLLVVITLVLIIESIWLNCLLCVSNYSKSIAMGALLSWFTQSIFIKIAIGMPKRGVWQHMVAGLYLGQMVKWLLTLLGFAVIFVWFNPSPSWGVLIGFMLMQLAHVACSVWWSKSIA